ncbi:DUF1707 and DUF4870 domain-containing protein [Nocardiopsis alkaliphila]|uniref:DUF1707 and DUF4870 domain-containing protein n=1 Tax=Nocardiopsis alkaliphila TaxID=225762 RepID=UPI000477EC0C|nr:DUF1707 and DUF4870 domain-containing protein [Nocardiopsis alkaliphila]
MSEQMGRNPAPWGQSGPRPQVRLTHADRDAVAEVLREAYSTGQLEEEEFDERLDQAMRAKVASELVPLTEDLGVSGFDESRFQGQSRGERGRFRGRGGRGPNDLRDLRTDNPVEKVGAGLSHASAFFFPLLGPLLVLLVSPNSSSFMRRHALEALNFQLYWLVAMIVTAVASVLILPILLLLAVAFGGLVLPIIGAATNIMGKGWRYPLTYRFIKDDEGE